MDPVELDLVSTDDLVAAIKRRCRSVVVITQEVRSGPGATVGHTVRYEGDPYAIATLCGIAARDAAMRIMSGPVVSPDDPRS